MGKRLNYCAKLFLLFLYIGLLTGCGRIDYMRRSVEVELGEPLSENVLDYLIIEEKDQDRFVADARLDISNIDATEAGNYKAKVLYGNEIISIPVKIADTTPPEIIETQNEIESLARITVKDLATTKDFSDTQLIILDDSGEEVDYIIAKVGMTVTLKAVDEFKNETIKEITPNVVKKELPTASNNLDSWIGTYVYYEEAIEDPLVKYLNPIEVEIYKEDGEYLAKITEDGQVTNRILAKVYGNEEWVSFVFLDYLPDNIYYKNKKNLVLLSFRNDNGKIYPYWGEIIPKVEESEDSGEIYFEKVE